MSQILVMKDVREIFVFEDTTCIPKGIYIVRAKDEREARLQALAPPTPAIRYRLVNPSSLILIDRMTFDGPDETIFVEGQ